MKFSSFVAMATTSAVALFSYSVEAQQPVPNFYPVRGAITWTNSVVRRLPVQTLASDRPDIYNMFLLALIDMQTNKLETDPLSYYQLSGIHGVPYIPWQETSVSTQDTSTGYCTHNSVLFATWHRPYLALFEERLVKHAIYVASKFTGSQAGRYRSAARNVRLPYWDWAATDLQARLPAQLKSTTVTVTRPGAGGVPETVSVTNPLREYRFRDDNLRNQYFSFQFQNSAFTRRQPPDSSLSSSNNAAVDAVMNRDYSSRRSATYALFSIPNFSDFSGTMRNTNGSPNAWNSVESVHNGVHVNCGGQWGHMTAVAYSAFDPVFWMHHCNIDRLIAMYQAVNPGSVIQPRPASGTFARQVSSSDVDTINTPLAPFRHPNGQYYTSQDVSTADSIWNFGYQYTEVPVSFRGNPSGLAAFTTSQINALYRDSSSSNKKRDVAYKRREWVCHMTYDNNELPSTSSIEIYFDKPNGSAPSGTGYLPKPTDAPKYHNGTTIPKSSVSDDAFYCGSASTLRDPGAKHMMSMNVTGAVYMSDALLEAGCPSLEPADVVPFLKERLQWVIRVGGVEEYPLSKTPSLKVGVSSSDVDYPAEDTKLPVWGEFETHYDVTDLKVCGFTLKDKGLVDSVVAPVVDAAYSVVSDIAGAIPTHVPIFGGSPSSSCTEEAATATHVYKPTSTPVYHHQPSETPSSTCTDEIHAQPTEYVPVEKASTIWVTSYTTVCPATCTPEATPTLAAY
ncbi:common central domain of tyrosinase-domain-containing protein [Sphaerosporella brunnea]|uniref:tyrosinase n=1 Tax=Sphaerosporella brunnea TaxID=1250544 RepID=A0A5J5EI82_9PEZI|nr:common central domain of tyrosinase-domain-containing protein [Sphaerosporella brunnea]